MTLGKAAGACLVGGLRFLADRRRQILHDRHANHTRPMPTAAAPASISKALWDPDSNPAPSPNQKRPRAITSAPTTTTTIFMRACLEDALAHAARHKAPDFSIRMIGPAFGRLGPNHSSARAVWLGENTVNFKLGHCGRNRLAGSGLDKYPLTRQVSHAHPHISRSDLRQTSRFDRRRRPPLVYRSRLRGFIEPSSGGLRLCALDPVGPLIAR
jgi:hypothetical protein